MKEETSRLSLQGWLFAQTPVGWSGKMSPAYFQATKAKISPNSSRTSPDGKFPSPRAGGGSVESSPLRQVDLPWVGECLTLNIPEFPNFLGRSRSDGDVSSLSDIVETGNVSPEFSLTASCAAGILRRAELRQDPLPPEVQLALERASRST